VPQHHFLVMTFNLMWVPSLDELGQMAEDLDPLPLGLGVEYVSKIGEISNIGVVFYNVPAVKLKRTLPLLQRFQQPSALNRHVV
jgi:hypothetical protein